MERLVQDLRGPFDLSIDRKPETEYFQMQTQFVHFAFDGKRTGTETYRFNLRFVPAALSGKNLDECTCQEFSLQLNASAIVTIPALKLWTYQLFSRTDLMFGIPHDRFEGLTDSLGNKIAPDIRYAIYNNFIDFHALNDAFSRPLKFGKGIQDLKFIGDRIVHMAAFTKAPVNLGTAVKAGSFFHNGEVTLELKGVSVVDGAACAMVGYDSGESTLELVMATSSGQEIMMKGGSEYKGHIYIDLETAWVRKVTLDESVVTESSVPNALTKIDGYTARHILLRLISQPDFEKGLAISS